VTHLQHVTPTAWPHADSNAATRFAVKVRAVTDHPRVECWIWIGGIESDDGYGRFRPGDGASSVAAHRWSHIHATGACPRYGLEVRHRCHIRLCVNPTHLTVGTRADNIADSVTAGRFRNLAHHGDRGLARSLAIRDAALSGDIDTVVALVAAADQLALALGDIAPVLEHN
jgi:hypothetical protein